MTFSEHNWLNLTPSDVEAEEDIGKLYDWGAFCLVDPARPKECPSCAAYVKANTLSQQPPKPQFTDWRGTPIFVGSMVVYPQRRGSSMWVIEGKVVELGTEDRFGKEFVVGKVKRTKENFYSVKELDGRVVQPDFSRVTVVG